MMDVKKVEKLSLLFNKAIPKQTNTQDVMMALVLMIKATLEQIKKNDKSAAKLFLEAGIRDYTTMLKELKAKK